MSTTIESLAQEFPEVKELLEAYDNCLTEIGNQRTTISEMNEIMTGMQQTINSLVLEATTLRPLLSKGLELRQAQTSYYSLRKKQNSKRLQPAEQESIDKQAREWLVASKIVETDFDALLTKAAQLQEPDQPPAEPDQPELL